MSPWGAAGAHSIYLDSLLDLGALGALALALIFLLGIKRSISHYREGSDPHFAFVAALLLFCALDGVLESITSLPGLLTFLCMVVLARLGFQWLPQKVRRA
jgi:O-antigen ligase